MSNIIKTFVILAILSVAVFLDVLLHSYLNKHRTQDIIEQQDIINQQFNDKLLELQETVEYVDFGLDVNNKLLEEILMEQIQKKGD